MKKVAFILIALGIVSIFLFPQDNQERFEKDQQVKQMKNDQEQKNTTPMSQMKAKEVASKNLFSLIGKTSTELTKQLGTPARIDPSAYDYEWWIYNQSDESYIQVGVLNDKVVTIYGIGEDIDINPFEIGQPMEDIYKTVQIASNVSLTANGNSYQFEISETDMNTRPLIHVEQGFAQLYIDQFTGELSSIRLMDGETLIKHRPYELVYWGGLINPQDKTKEEWEEIDKANAQQIFDITNVLRKRHGLNSVKWDRQVANVAFQHSKDMSDQSYFSHTSPTKGNLSDRLQQGDVRYLLAGENIAAQYVDSISAVEGWLNSEGHRKALLNKDFTHLGVGVYRSYYTQNFIQKLDKQ